MALPSRAVAVAAFRFALVALLVVVVLTGTTLVISYLISCFRDGPWDDPQYLYTGFVCGLIVWLFVAVFHLRRETQTMQFSQREQYLAKAKSVLQEMGYALVAQQGWTLTYRPKFQSYLAGGAIHLELENQEARITGPRVSLDIFRRCFRLLNHVQRVQLYLQDHRKFTDNIIKRVELRLRLRPDQFQAVRSNIIEVLEKDAKVICELNLLVQSEHGIRENILEFQIREWLEQNGIDCVMHKDIVQFVEVVHPELETEAAAH